MAKAPNWAPEELQYLHDAYTACIPAEVIAVQLDRPVYGVYLKASRLNLTDAKRSKSPEHVEFIRARMKAWWKTLDSDTIRKITSHVCSDETRAKISKGGKLAYKEGRHVIGDQERQARSDNLKRLRATHPRFGHPGTGSAGKRADIGFYVRSRWEANVARIFLWCQSAGIFERVEYEPRRFEFGAIKRGVRSYLPDFRITWPDQQTEYVEVKGWFDPKSKTALSRFSKYYPDESLWLIDSSVYKELTACFADDIPEWET